MADDPPPRILPHPSLAQGGYRATPEYIETLRTRALKHAQALGRARPGAFARVLDGLGRPAVATAAPRARPRPARPAAAAAAGEEAGWPLGPQGPVVLRG